MERILKMKNPNFHPDLHRITGFFRLGVLAVLLMLMVVDIG